NDHTPEVANRLITMCFVQCSGDLVMRGGAAIHHHPEPFGSGRHHLSCARLDPAQQSTADSVPPEVRVHLSETIQTDRSPRVYLTVSRCRPLRPHKPRIGGPI